MSDWQLLARGEQGFAVLRCPAGHIHVEVAGGMTTLRFEEREFVAFAHMIMQGLGAVSTKGLLKPVQLPLVEHFSSN